VEEERKRESRGWEEGGGAVWLRRKVVMSEKGLPAAM